MHYYQFNIGDYSSHTSRLSIHEDIAYRRLLDLYYLNERPFNGCSKDVAREIGMTDFLGDVEYILTKFFTKSGDKWVNKRCDSEIKAYHNKQKSASKAGKASAKARQSKASERTFNDNPTDVQPTINHKPITKNQEDQNILSGKPDPAPQYLKKSKAILEFLNEKAGRNFKPVAAHTDMIKARLKEGYEEAEFRQVIAKKVREWAHDENMNNFLRPKTLFNKTNFANYVGELV